MADRILIENYLFLKTVLVEQYCYVRFPIFTWRKVQSLLRVRRPRFSFDAFRRLSLCKVDHTPRSYLSVFSMNPIIYPKNIPFSHTIPYTRFAMKKQETPKTISPAVTSMQSQ